MPRLVPVNADFETALQSFRDAPGLVAALRSALAVAPGDAITAEEYPLCGFHLTSTDKRLLAYFVTPGLFVRYELADRQSLTITVPIERIRRVVEHAGPTWLRVTVELDADTAVAVTEAKIGPDPDSLDDDRIARAVTRTTATTYELVVEAADGGDVELTRLATFSRGLRAALGT